ncbi:hypothetical protein E3E31_08865 [Thermococcus sp. M39]|uniref:hypothetical protein n=1 Tax=unclassified Thermococcus TaxID=2627626 RepID=UPI001439151E|nr:MULTISPECIES: hypothetical protein [unclassified Thermococcus]NJE08628.1 hypothetical protein [Thermococcus sp. M39]NJE13236.1 hypothetical protein [Thermococcus sp. LS2]
MRVRTLYDELDEVMGGGLSQGSTMAILYDTYSFAQYFALHILAKRIKSGDLGVLSNYSYPLGRLIRGAQFAGLDIVYEGKKGNVVIIDYFSSRYGVLPRYPFVYTLPGHVGEETINPKTFLIYQEKVLPNLGDRVLFRVIYTLDGLAFFFGENTALKLLYSDLAKFMEMFPKSVTLLLVNKDAVSKHFVARVVDISDYVIDFRSQVTKKGIIEDVVITKALTPEFSPEIFEFLVGETKEEAGDKFSFKKVSE